MNVHFEDEKETDMVSIMCEMVFDCVSKFVKFDSWSFCGWCVVALSEVERALNRGGNRSDRCSTGECVCARILGLVFHDL